jgi:MatE
LVYALMGGRDGSLAAATTYSAIVFAGAIPLWLFNSFAAIIRGTGNVFFPAAVIIAGAFVLIPLSPLLIFGLGPFPHLGIAGGAAAVLLYYVSGCVVLASYIWSRRGVLNPSLIPPRLAWAPVRDILRVGAVSSIVSLSTNVSIATATGLAGLVGPAAVAGYGTGARLEYLLVPLVFGLGAPVAAMVGTCIGAGRRDRALRVAWTGAACRWSYRSDRSCGSVFSVSLAVVVRERSEHDRNRIALFAHCRSDLRLLRRGSRVVFRLARCGPRGLGHDGGGTSRHDRRRRWMARSHDRWWQHRPVRCDRRRTRNLRIWQCSRRCGRRMVQDRQLSKSTKN